MNTCLFSIWLITQGNKILVSSCVIHRGGASFTGPGPGHRPRDQAPVLRTLVRSHRLMLWPAAGLLMGRGVISPRGNTGNCSKLSSWGAIKQRLVLSSTRLRIETFFPIWRDSHSVTIVTYIYCLLDVTLGRTIHSQIIANNRLLYKYFNLDGSSCSRDNLSSLYWFAAEPSTAARPRGVELSTVLKVSSFINTFPLKKKKKHSAQDRNAHSLLIGWSCLITWHIPVLFAEVACKV